ncbi:MAG: ribosome biogenesis GTPase Der [Bdellovibrionales bacterium]|nr:ribosome biogenesis GTPase Der [Bdellovibrionales bacterium]
MSRKAPKIALIGRTNVGKSTLFNVLCNKNKSITEDIAGVTRDRSYALISVKEKVVNLIDTGGILGESEDPLAAAVHEQSTLALNEADIIIAVFDGIYGVHPDDSNLVQLLREAQKPVIWVINKCEKPRTREEAVEFYELGLESYIWISAAHRQNLHELVGAIVDAVEVVEAGTPSEEEDDEERAIRIAIVGKPNVGKSSLVNRLIGSERVIASELPGTTRDTIDVELTRDGQKFILVDTAGLRRKSHVPEESLERYANVRALKALARCDVALLLLDASEDPLVSDQERRIADLLHRRGIPFILVCNKWDKVEKDNTSVKAYSKKVFERLNFCRYAPLLFLSAETGRRCPKIFPTVKEVHESAATRVRTSELNRVLLNAFEKNPPPVYRGHPVKMYFATQVTTTPPTVLVFVNFPQNITQTYERYLKKKLQEHFSFAGTDIKLQIRKRRNQERDNQFEEESGAGF